MITMIIMDQAEGEARWLMEHFRLLAARETDQKLDIYRFYGKENDAMAFKGLIAHMAAVDVCSREGILFARQVRRALPEAEILAIAREGLSPNLYLTPDIRPSSVLLRPLRGSLAENTCREFFLAGIGREESASSRCLLAWEGGGRVLFPYEAIWCLEARNKKVYVHTRQGETGIYDTIEHLSSILPDSFVRCHRSYIVNRRKVEKVLLAEKLIQLEGGLKVPLAGRYRDMWLLAADAVSKRQVGRR